MLSFFVRGWCKKGSMEETKQVRKVKKKRKEKSGGETGFQTCMELVTGDGHA